MLTDAGSTPASSTNFSTQIQNNYMNELNRRQYVSQLARQLLGVGLFPLIGSQVRSDTGGMVTPKKKAHARQVIYLNMSGAMSHVDTFDPKPDSDETIRGPVQSIQTSADGILLSEYLPNIARNMHNAALVRSVTSNQGAHMQAGYLMHTSYQKRGTITHPTFGSWVSKLTGSINTTIPNHVKINGGAGGSGFLEAKHGAVPIGNPRAGLANSRAADYLDINRFDSRLSLTNQMNKSFISTYDMKQTRAYTDLYRDAVKLMRSSDLQAFDITQEPADMTELYGDTSFGQGCLLARRLMENGVRYVEVSRGGWDTHSNNFERVQANCEDMDRAVGALLHDLDRRGMLSDVLVVLTSEFGRTPKINGGNGRDHWPNAFSAMFAGAGIKGGTVYGRSDEQAMRVAENPVKPGDLNATIAHLLGMEVNNVHYSPSGRPFKVAHDGDPIMDITTI
jgi:hypothetical protein